MGAYVKISYSSKITGNYNFGLRHSFVYIGRRYGKLANIEGLDDNQYLKEGIAYIAKKIGKYRKSAIKYMIYPKKIKDSINKQWCYHKQVYAKAYFLILEHLFNAPPKDMDYVYILLITLYYENCNSKNDVNKMCSDALLYWQKKMLYLNRNDVTDGENSGILLRDILKYDKMLP